MMKTNVTSKLLGLMFGTLIAFYSVGATPKDDCLKGAQNTFKEAKTKCKAMEKDQRKACFKTAKEEYNKTKNACPK